MTETVLPDVAVRPAAAEDRPTVERLWLMFRHDLSGVRGALPGPDGTFRDEWLESAFTRPGRALSASAAHTRSASRSCAASTARCGC